MPKFKTASGRLTAYAFACGYVETIDGVTISLQHGVYDIRSTDARTQTGVWATARTVTEARDRAAMQRRHNRKYQ